MAITYSQADVAVGEIANRLVANRNRLDQAAAQIAQAQADVSAMTDFYATIVSDIATAANDNPTDSAWLAMNAAVTLLMAEVSVLATAASTQGSALQQIKG